MKTNDTVRRRASLGAIGLIAVAGLVAGAAVLDSMLAPQGGVVLEEASADPSDLLANPIVSGTCTYCHTVDRIDRKALDRAGWEAVVRRMREYMDSAGGSMGRLDDTQFEQLVGFLAERRGADHAAEPWAASDLLRARCSQCHGVDRILTVRKTPEAWAVAVEKMRWYASRRIQRDGAGSVTAISEEEGREIAAWLARERPLLAEEVVAGQQAAWPLVVESMCTTCHDMDSINNTVKSPEEWDDTVHRMENFRAGWSNQWSNRFSSLRGENRTEAMEAAINFLQENRQADTPAWRRFEERRRSGVDRLKGSWSVFGRDARGGFQGTINFAPAEGQPGHYNAVRTVRYADGETLTLEGEADLFGDAIRATFKMRRASGAADILGAAFEDDEAPEAGETTIRASLTLNEAATYAEGAIGGSDAQTAGREVYARGAPNGSGNPDDFAPPGGGAIAPAILLISPAVAKKGEEVDVLIQGVGFPRRVSAEQLSLGAGLSVVSVDAGASSPVAISAKVTVSDDAALGMRTATLQLETGNISGGEIGIYDKADHLRVEPGLGLSRVGGHPLVAGRQDPGPDDTPLQKKFERFRAYAWSNGPDGEPYNDDDVMIGPVKATWETQAIDIHRGREWTEGEGASHSQFDINESTDGAAEVHMPGIGKFWYVINEPKNPTLGSIDQNGLYTPGSDEPMLELSSGGRGRPRDGTDKNNTGDNRGTALIVATATVDGEDLKGEGVCVVAPPDYVPWVPYYGPSHSMTVKLAADRLARENGND